MLITVADNHGKEWHVPHLSLITVGDDPFYYLVLHMGILALLLLVASLSLKTYVHTVLRWPDKSAEECSSKESPQCAYQLHSVE